MLYDLASRNFRFPSQWVNTFNRLNLVALPVIACIIVIFFDPSSDIHWRLDVSLLLSHAQRLVNWWILWIKAGFWNFPALRIQVLDIKWLILSQPILHLLCLCPSLPYQVWFFFNWIVQMETNRKFLLLHSLSSHNVSCWYLSVVHKTFRYFYLMIWGIYIVRGWLFNRNVVVFRGTLFYSWLGAIW